MSSWPCKEYLKGFCNNSFCEKCHPPECLFHKTKSGCRFGEKCSFAHRQVDEQPTKRSKKNDGKSAVAMFRREIGKKENLSPMNVTVDWGNLGREVIRKLGQNSSNRQYSDARQLGCVFQDMTPPKSILRKCSDMRKPIQRVKFTKAIARHNKVRDKTPRSVTFVQVHLMSVAPMLQNLRIVHKKRPSGKSKVPAKQCGSWPRVCSN